MTRFKQINGQLTNRCKAIHTGALAVRLHQLQMPSTSTAVLDSKMVRTRNKESSQDGSCRFLSTLRIASAISTQRGVQVGGCRSTKALSRCHVGPEPADSMMTQHLCETRSAWSWREQGELHLTVYRKPQAKKKNDLIACAITLQPNPYQSTCSLPGIWGAVSLLVLMDSHLQRADPKWIGHHTDSNQLSGNATTFELLARPA